MANVSEKVNPELPYVVLGETAYFQAAYDFHIDMIYHRKGLGSD